MTLGTTTIRPGLLVSLKTSLEGNINYIQRVLSYEKVLENGSTQKLWETKRVIADPIEYNAAHIVRSKACAGIKNACARSSFGLLCPQAESAALDLAIEEARRLAAEFNATAKITRLHIYVMVGRVAPDDAEAIKAINYEMRNLMDSMATGIANLEVKQVRDAAGRARSISNMLSEDAKARVKEAIAAARKSARQIVKLGEGAAQEIDRAAIERISAARTAFLDLGSDTEIETPVAPARVVEFDARVEG